MDHVLKLGAVDVVKLIGRDDLDICHKERRVEARIDDSARDITDGIYAVDQVDIKVADIDEPNDVSFRWSGVSK